MESARIPWMLNCMRRTSLLVSNAAGHAAAVHHDVADEMPTAMMKVMLAHGDGGTDARTCGSVTVMVIMILLTATKRSIMPSCLA